MPGWPRSRARCSTGWSRAIGAHADYAADVTGWARAGLEAVQDLPDSGRSLGIPTWHYGHEPPNPFASAVAKYFRNAIREDVLLEVSHHGIVFLPGAAGTVQEVFQAACTNYYATARDVAPMVFVGREYWTERATRLAPRQRPRRRPTPRGAGSPLSMRRRMPWRRWASRVETGPGSAPSSVISGSSSAGRRSDHGSRRR